MIFRGQISVSARHLFAMQVLETFSVEEVPHLKASLAEVDSAHEKRWVPTFVSNSN